jgi:AraC-like DNA-binding protein
VLLSDTREQPRALFMEWAHTFERYRASSIAQQAARVVRQHVSTKLNAMKVGRMLGVSELTIKAAFRREFSMTIQQYQDVTRILEALRRLGEADHKIEPLAADVGYRSKDTFFRAFRRLTGMTPAAFRRLSAIQREHITDHLKHILTSGSRLRTRTAPCLTKAAPSLSETLGSSRSTA